MKLREKRENKRRRANKRIRKTIQGPDFLNVVLASANTNLAVSWYVPFFLNLDVSVNSVETPQVPVIFHGVSDPSPRGDTNVIH